LKIQIKGFPNQTYFIKNGQRFDDIIITNGSSIYEVFLPKYFSGPIYLESYTTLTYYDVNMSQNQLFKLNIDPISSTTILTTRPATETTRITTKTTTTSTTTRITT